MEAFFHYHQIVRGELFRRAALVLALAPACSFNLDSVPRPDANGTGGSGGAGGTGGSGGRADAGTDGGGGVGFSGHLGLGPE